MILPYGANLGRMEFSERTGQVPFVRIEIGNQSRFDSLFAALFVTDILRLVPWQDSSAKGLVPALRRPSLKEAST
jgi:hypothetical protein